MQNWLPWASDERNVCRVAQAEFGFLEPKGERVIFSRELLGIDEHVQTLVEPE